MSKKNIVSIISGYTVFCLCISILAGCAPHGSPTPGPTAGHGSLEAFTPVAALALPTAVRVTPAANEDASTQQTAWLQMAELGPYAPSSQDLAAIVEAAKREGKVTIYSNSSRLKYAAEEFMARYPEIDVEALDIGTKDSILTLRNEQMAREYHCDVYFAGDAPTLLHELLPGHMVWPFVPAELQAVIPNPYRDPLLVQRLSIDFVIYNSDTYDAPPIDNWWDLTRPEWAGKVVLQNPLHHPARMYLFVSMVQQAEKMAEAYETEFGERIQLDEECPNAGYQWIKAFLANEPSYLLGGIEIAEAVGTPDQFDPPLGIAAYAQYSKVIRHNLYFEPLFDLAPCSGVSLPTYLAIANGAPHPNAAKLMIHWLMGEPSEERMGGFAPWWVLGEYSPRSDIPDPEHAYPWAALESRLWPLDSKAADDDVQSVRAFWERHTP